MTRRRIPTPGAFFSVVLASLGSVARGALSLGVAGDRCKGRPPLGQESFAKQLWQEARAPRARARCAHCPLP